MILIPPDIAIKHTHKQKEEEEDEEEEEEGGGGRGRMGRDGKLISKDGL